MKCVISCSFRKHYANIRKTITEFEILGVEVLSPRKSKIINPGEEFAILETDTSKNMRILETEHLEAIRSADFLYVCDPSGYVGPSALMEIGFAITRSKCKRGRAQGF